MIDDHYYQTADTGTVHLANDPRGPALCNYDWDGKGTLVLNTGVDTDALCGNCEAKVC